MDLIRRLHEAIKNNDERGIQAAVAAGADMDQVWGMQGTALCQAIGTHRQNIVALLLDLGCDVNGEDFDGGFPLSLAIRKHLSDIALLLMAMPSCDVNALDPVAKQRPLCAAVTEGLSDVVEALVQDQRCNITQGNSVGNSALHLSLLHRQDTITKVLARCEGFRFLHNLAGHAPVHIVATLGHTHSLDLLFPAPARRAEAFHRAEVGSEVMGDKSSPVIGSGFALAALQQELNQRATYTGDTALHLAVREKHNELAERLIALGAAVDIQNNSGQTALLLACANDTVRLAIQLLKSGAPPNVAGHLRMQQRTLLATHSRESSLTPLHVAASANHTELVRALCEFGADINFCDERGRSPLYMALLNGAGDVAVYLLGRPDQSLHTSLGGSSLLHAACQCPSQAAHITAALLARGCSHDQPNRLGNLPLHEALCWENVDVVRILLEQGADPSARGELGALPLTFAARTGRVEMAELLLAAGANVNGADPQGDSCLDSDMDSDEVEWSPLHEALQAGMVDFARYLVEAGCDLSQEKYLFTEHPISNLAAVPTAALPDLDDLDVSDDEEEEESDVPFVVRDNQELFDWLREKARNPHSLVQLCLEAVRGVFRKGDPPFALMLALPLPEKVIARLLYKAEL